MASVILQNHHNHPHHQVINFTNRNSIKSNFVLNNNNNGVNFSGGSSSSSSQFNFLRQQQQQQQSAELGNGGSDGPGIQQPVPPKPDADIHDNNNGAPKRPEGVSSAPNGSSKGIVTRAVLAQKYLVQFEESAIAGDVAAKQPPCVNDNNNNCISTNTPPTPHAPHVGPTKVPLKCVKLATKEVMQCKITLRDDRGVSILAAHQRLGECEDFVNPISELIVHPKYFYLISPATYGNLHSYIYSKSALKEAEAKSLFKQMVSIVNFCHQRGVVLRDLKLGRFVFTDKERTTIKLESLEDVAILPKPDSDDDSLDDTHGCPNYVSPEKTECVVKNGAVKYSGKNSDVWALGVSLYAMLAGRYPFNENDCSRLLRKIRTGGYSPIDGISPIAKSLVRCLLAKNPQDRPGCKEVLNHPWFRTEHPLATTPLSSQLASSTIRTSSGAVIRRDLDTTESECRSKRMRMASEDDQVVPGS